MAPDGTPKSASIDIDSTRAVSEMTLQLGMYYDEDRCGEVDWFKDEQGYYYQYVFQVENEGRIELGIGDKEAFQAFIDSLQEALDNAPPHEIPTPDD